MLTEAQERRLEAAVMRRRRPSKGGPRPGMAARGEAHANRKLTAFQVREIRLRLSAGEGVCAVARAFHIHLSTVQAIRDRRTWAHLPEETNALPDG